MEVEIQDFFIKKLTGPNYKSFTGSMKILLPEKKLQILGINVKKNNNRWFFTIPGMKTNHNDTGELIAFPFISFTDKEEKQIFFNQLKENAISYIIERIKDNSLKIPVRNEKTHLAKGQNRQRFAKKVQNNVLKKRSFVAKANQSTDQPFCRSAGK
jgi:hypothetical protein